MPLPVKKGVDGIPTGLIPDDPQAFVYWFQNSFLPRWAGNADTRNAIQGVGISITGDIASPATIAVSTDVQKLFGEPYTLAAAPSDTALTGYRVLAPQAGVLTVTDGGATSTVTVGVAANGIGNGQIRQGAATSIIGNAGGSLANVADIAAGADNTTLVRAAGALSFSALPLAAIANISASTILGNNTAGLAVPSALTASQVKTVLAIAYTDVSGLAAVAHTGAYADLSGTPAIPTGANPSASVGLASVNGVAATWMRSDGAPALSQAIAPTWTGNHAFQASSGISIATTQAGSNSVAFQSWTDGTAIAKALLNANFQLGTTTAHNVVLFTNNTTAVTIGSAGAVVIAKPSSGNALTLTGNLVTDSLTASPPTIQTGNYAQLEADYSIIFNGAGSITLTLLSASTHSGRTLLVKTIAAQTVVSSTSNVKPRTTNTAGTAILAGVAGTWVLLQSDGTNWVTMAGN